MQIRKRRGDLAMVIVTAAFFVLAAALFYLIPTLDQAVAASPIGIGPYNPVKLFLEGLKAFGTFNFASTKYLVIFLVGVVVVLLLIFWLIAIIVKKAPKKLILWAITLVMVAVSAIMVSGLALANCRADLALEGLAVIGYYDGDGNFISEKTVITQDLWSDLLNKYTPYVVDVAKYVKGYKGDELYANVVQNVFFLTYVVFAAIAFVGVFGIVTPLVGAIGLFKKPRVVSTEEDAAVEQAESEEEARRRASRENLVSYVEYEAGKEARDKEYEELCRAHGIALEKDKYYSSLTKELAVFSGEAQDEDLYYKQLAKQLGILNGSSEEDAYYKEVVKELGILNGSLSEDEAYYRALSKELPALQTQDEPVETAQEYRARLLKELPVLKVQKIGEQKESYEHYVARLSKELPILERPVVKEEKKETEEEYIARLSKELPALKKEAKVPVEKKESEEEYIARLSKELPVLAKPEVEKKESDEEYFARVSKELPALKKEVEVPVEKKESEEEYIARLSKELPVLNREAALAEAKEEPKEESEEEYRARLMKELQLFRLIDASREVELSKYYRNVISELDSRSKKDPDFDEAIKALKRRIAEEQDVEEAVENLKRKNKEDKAYYERMVKQLGLLNKHSSEDEDDE